MHYMFVEDSYNVRLTCPPGIRILVGRFCLSRGIKNKHLKAGVVPVYRFILTPGQLDPRGSRYPRAAWPPGVKISRGIFTPALIIFTPGLGILTPTPDFCFWNYKKFSYGSKKCSDIFESNCFLTKLIYFIGHSYMFHCMSRIEGGGQDTVAWVSWPPPRLVLLKS